MERWGPDPRRLRLSAAVSGDLPPRDADQVAERDVRVGQVQPPGGVRHRDQVEDVPPRRQLEDARAVGVRAARRVCVRELRPGRLRPRQPADSGVRRAADDAVREGLRGIEVTVPEPARSLAGLVQSTSRFGSVVRPKSEFGGAGALEPEKATTQPIWRGSRQARTRLKSPPRSLPFATVTFPPSRMAETSFLRMARFGSISSRISFRS